MKKIILTGGGTAGHVTPNLALLPSLKEAGYEIRYIGSYQGMERKLIENAGIHYDGISIVATVNKMADAVEKIKAGRQA